MSLRVLSPASGISDLYRKSVKVIRLARHGCTNRPFYHIVVTGKRKNQHAPVIEQVGSYDPIPNEHNERLVALNFERIRHWIGNGAYLSQPVAEVLGIAGFYPIHPRTYMTSWRNRQKLRQQEEQTKQQEVKQSEAQPKQE